MRLREPEMFMTKQGVDLIFNEPKCCPRCHAMTAWFRNSNGQSGCIHCFESRGTHALHAA